MGSLWEYFFRKVNADTKKLQNEDPTYGHGAGKNTRKDSTVHGENEKGKSGPEPRQRVDNKSTVQNDKSFTSKKTASTEKKVASSPENSKDLTSAASQADQDRRSKETKNTHQRHSQNQGDDHMYRDCGHVRTRRLDTNLPDDVEQSELEPVNSNIPECYKLKVEYDQCFQRWFADEFLNGASSLEPCEDIMKRYTACVKKGLQEQNIILYPSHCLYGSTDPNDHHKLDHPRKKPPPGATVHHG